MSSHQAGRLAEAKPLYLEILSRAPNHVVVLNLLGVLRSQEGDARQAVDLIGRAIALKPDYTEAYYNLGVALKDQGKLAEAAAAYRRALKLNPNYAAAHNNLGIALEEQGNPKGAETAYRHALKLKPGYAAAYNNLGNALKDQDRLEEAVTAYRKALKLNPDFARAHFNLGVALKEQGRPDEEIAAYRKALKLSPDYAAAHNNLGNALRNQGKLVEAMAAYQRSLELDPGLAEAHNNLGSALKDQGKLKEAAEAYHRALALSPDFADAYVNLGIVFKDQGRLEDAVAAHHRALMISPDHAKAHGDLLFCMHYDAQTSQSDILAESRRWGEIHQAPCAPDDQSAPNNPDPDRRLRIGYVSPDFREHSVSYFLAPVIAEHDRGAVEVFCYAEVTRPDDTTARFRDLADGWCSTVGMTDAAVAERIRKDKIDILVDLAGHTANNRLLVFAERPAPVQVTWLGYPNTTGLSTMDYRLTDAIADPEGAADTQHVETLVRLPNGFLCYSPASGAPEIGGTPALATGHVTFGSFNNLPKVTPEVVETWSKILHRVPNSRLVIKSLPLDDAETRMRYFGMFGAQEIDAERVELVSWVASTSGHLEAYNKIDIGLDPFPYNGTTTTCEALWMGVPVVSLRGDRHSGRVGASILTRLDLADLVADTTAVYVEKAAELANDLERLSEMRHGLRDQLERSSMCDAPNFARDIEAAYRDMWCQACT